MCRELGAALAAASRELRNARRPRKREWPAGFRKRVAVALMFEDDNGVLVLAASVLARPWAQVHMSSYDEVASQLRAASGCPAWKELGERSLASRGGARLRFLVSLVLAESRVALWLVRANTRGVAVSSAQLSSWLRAAWPSRGWSWNSERFLIRLRQLTHLRKQFAKAFRRRWGIRWRRLPARAEFVAADLLVRFRSQARTRDTKRGPMLGTKNGPRFGDRAGIVGKDEVPKVGTTLGPKNGTTFAPFSRPQVRDFFSWTHWLYGVVLPGIEFLQAVQQIVRLAAPHLPHARAAGTEAVPVPGPLGASSSATPSPPFALHPRWPPARPQ